MRGSLVVCVLGWNLACAAPVSPAAPTTESPATTPPPKSVSPPPAAPAPPLSSKPAGPVEPPELAAAVPRPPAPEPTHVLKLHEPVKLAGGYTLQVESVVVEAIEPSADGVYPGGGAVEVVLLLERDLYQRRASLLEITEGYDPKLVAWLDDFRVRLVEVEDIHAQPTVAVAIERVRTALTGEPPTHHRLAQGESFTLDDGDRIEFTGHSHKRTGPGQTSPLIVHLDWHTPGQAPASDTESIERSSRRRKWRWRDVEFTLVDWKYDDWIEIDVRRLKRRRLTDAG